MNRRGVVSGRKCGRKLFCHPEARIHRLEFIMKILISLGLLLVTNFYSGAFEVPPVWGDDLRITLENEVAGITPGMEILGSKTGTLLGNENPNSMANSGSNLYINKNSKPRKSYYSRKPRKLIERKSANAGFITTNLVPVGAIAKLFEQKLGTTGPDEVFVDMGKGQGIEKGDQFTVYSLDRYIYHPILSAQGGRKLGEYERRSGYANKDILSHPGKPVGHRVKIHGLLEITEPGDKVSYARVLKAYDSIGVGDLLTPYQKIEDQTSTSSKEDDKFIEGYIIASKGDRIGINYDDIIYIDKGWEDRVRPGDLFEVYSIPNIKEKVWNKLKPQKIPLIPFVRGKIKVIATQKKTATAIVLKSRIDMEIGNRIRFKPADHPG
jgi:hypothetical protein